MVFLKMYEEVVSVGSLELKNEDIDRFLTDDAEKPEVEEAACLFLLLGQSTKESVLLRVRALFSRYSEEEKVVIFDKLVGHIDSISIETLVRCISGADYVTAPALFTSIFRSDSISCIDKYILYSDILDEGVSGKTLHDFTNRVIEVCKSILTNPDSAKGEVRMSVALLRRIAKELDMYGDAECLVSELYKNNELWRELYREEVKHRHETLMESFGEIVSAAFRNKDYERVVRLVGKYEDELPETLMRKLEYSKKHLV